VCCSLRSWSSPSSSSSFCSHLRTLDLIYFKGFISFGSNKSKEFCKEYFGVIYTWRRTSSSGSLSCLCEWMSWTLVESELFGYMLHSLSLSLSLARSLDGYRFCLFCFRLQNLLILSWWHLSSVPCFVFSRLQIAWISRPLSVQSIVAIRPACSCSFCVCQRDRDTEI
jgi:hypothetical protein